ncbi:MAG: hypothetical protein AAF251_08325 [Pseudomonadota bacterium]
MGKLIDGLSELSETSEGSREGEFSIGGPDRKLKGAYHMQFGSLEDRIAKRSNSAKRPMPPVKPFKGEARPETAAFTPGIFESRTGAMIVFETTDQNPSVTVTDDAKSAIVKRDDQSSSVAFSRAVEAQSLTVSVVNGIATANLAWKE